MKLKWPLLTKPPAALVVRVTCPKCGNDSEVPVSHMTILHMDHASSYSTSCLACLEIMVKRIEPNLAHQLTAAGASWSAYLFSS